jgi:hypothetical protein
MDLRHKKSGGSRHPRRNARMRMYAKFLGCSMKHGHAGGRNDDMSPKAFPGNKVITETYKDVIFKKRGSSQPCERHPPHPMIRSVTTTDLTACSPMKSRISLPIVRSVRTSPLSANQRIISSGSAPAFTTMPSATLVPRVLSGT